MQMCPKPYIGVTGFKSWNEVGVVMAAMPYASPFQLMVGVLASSKTLRGEENRHPCRYPKREHLRSAFHTAPALSLVHLAVDEPGELLAYMLAAKVWTGGRIRGFQLNVAWPAPGIIEQYRDLMDSEGFRSTIVLQCGSAAMEVCGNDPYEIALAIADYGSLIDYALIDPSGGTGKEFDVAFAAECFRELERLCPNIGKGVAGGSHAGNLERFVPLIEEFGLFSIDAEEQLRDADDKLNVPETSRYVREAGALFEQYAAVA